MAGEYTVGVDGWLKCAFSTLRARPNLVMRGLALMLAYSLVSLGLGYVPGGDVLVMPLQIFVGIVLQAGWYLFCLRLIREEEPSPRVLFEPFSRYWQVLIISVLIPLVTMIGLLLLIIPGLYFWARFGMGIFASVDRKLDAGAALDYSSRITEGFRLQILLLHLLMAAVGVILVLPTFLEMENLGMISYVAYVFIFAPLTGLAYAAAYDSLSAILAEREAE